MKLNAEHPFHDGDNILLEVNLMTIAGYDRKSINSYGIAVVEALYGKANLFAASFGFEQKKPGSALKFNMPRSQVAIVESRYNFINLLMVPWCSL